MGTIGNSKFPWILVHSESSYLATSCHKVLSTAGFGIWSMISAGLIVYQNELLHMFTC
jgi:hypothetical protein